MRHRTTLRNAVIHTLTNGDAPPWPTMAEDRVYDTRSDPMIHQRGQTNLPAILVYTNNVDYVPINSHEPPFRCRGELIIELTMGSFDDQIQTDAELERGLDEFEEQVMDALFDYSRQSAQNFKKVYTKLLKAESVRLENASANHRLAMRDMVFVLEWTGKCFVDPNLFPPLKRISTLATFGSGAIVTQEVL